MMHNNMLYSIKHTYLGTKYYSCNKYKSKKCPAKLIVKADGIVIPKNIHMCIQICETIQTIDVREQMKKYLEEECMKDLSILPTAIWKKAMEEIKTIHGNNVTITLTRQYAISHINYIRRRVHGGDAYRAIEMPPVCNIAENDKRMFLQLNTYYSFNNVGRIIVFGHPELIRLLNYPAISLFIDGTFKVTLLQSSQCIILMMYDPSVDLYIPIFYILVDCKDEMCYRNVLHWVSAQTGFQINPRAITCDFEKGLMNAINYQFPHTKIIGCLFHFKQALRRKLLSLRINSDQIRDAMEPGKLDLLSIIAPNEIQRYGIPYIRSIIDESENVSKWTTFWSSFNKAWVKNYPTIFCNINDMILDEIDIVNRTNNPLEVYNRIFTSKFQNSTPSLLLFVEE